MDIATHSASDKQSGQTHCPKAYGIRSWFYFSLVIIVTVSFLVSQVVIQSVRSGSLAVSTLEEIFYPGVYWLLASGGVALLVASGLLLGLTLGFIVVRAFMHLSPCRAYGVMALCQAVPWIYFFSTSS